MRGIVLPIIYNFQILSEITGKKSGLIDYPFYYLFSFIFTLIFSFILKKSSKAIWFAVCPILYSAIRVCLNHKIGIFKKQRFYIPFYRSRCVFCFIIIILSDNFADFRFLPFRLRLLRVCRISRYRDVPDVRAPIQN